MSIKKSAIKVLSAAILFCWLLPNVVYGYWEWTPETGRWINPRYAAKDTPEEQFQWAEEYVDRNERSMAIRKFNQLREEFPDSPLAAESAYRIGEIYEDAGNLERAFNAYREVVEKYPFSKRVPDAIARQYAIGLTLTQSGIRRIFRSRQNPAEILIQTVEAAPFMPEATTALWELGRYQLRRRQYAESMETLDLLVNDYPDSALAAPAELEAARAAYLAAQRQRNNQKMLDAAEQRLGIFLARNPEEGELRTEAEDLYQRVRERQANLVLTIAMFYERNRNDRAADIYYRKVVTDFPGTEAATRAAEKLE